MKKSFVVVQSGDLHHFNKPTVVRVRFTPEGRPHVLESDTCKALKRKKRSICSPKGYKWWMHMFVNNLYTIEVVPVKHKPRKRKAAVGGRSF